MDKVNIPTCGRIVHYFPVNDQLAKTNNAEKLPAIVVQSWESPSVNLSVHTASQDAPVVLRFSVPHISAAATSEGKIIQDYWDWPVQY